MEKNIRQQFRDYFGKEASVASAAPGRVNLIGEHTDYNEGFVLPGAIDKRIYVAISQNNERKINMYASQYQNKFSVDVDDIHPVESWPTYLLGMFYFLQKHNSEIGGLDILIDGDVPVGAGMSSSAAICSAFGFGLNELFNWKNSRMDLALTGQKTEHEFAGVKCGIMDQFASLHGKSGHVVKLDCRSLDYEYIPFNFPSYKIVLVNTLVSHSLAGSEYNTRRRQCEEGVSILQKHFPGVHSLRDINSEQLELHKSALSEIVYKRCHFVIHENLRLLHGCQFLSDGDIVSFGQLMYQSHEGLSTEYEVSCNESDFLVNMARSFQGVVGARQMGGGFGGCTINIIRNEQVENFSGFIREAYEKEVGKTPEIYTMQIEDGARLI